MSADSDEVRIPRTRVVLLHGAVIGLLAFAAAELSIPRSVTSPSDHDLFLARRLGLVFAPFAGIWLGWIQREGARILRGTTVGAATAVVYYQLCGGRDFAAIQILYPCVLGGAFAAVVGSRRSRPWRDAPLRLLLGLLAGLALGFTYSAVLTLMLFPYAPRDYALQMWKGGAPAMAAASAVFLLLLLRAVGLGPTARRSPPAPTPPRRGRSPAP